MAQSQIKRVSISVIFAVLALAGCSSDDNGGDEHGVGSQAGVGGAAGAGAGAGSGAAGGTAGMMNVGGTSGAGGVGGQAGVGVTGGAGRVGGEAGTMVTGGVGGESGEGGGGTWRHRHQHLPVRLQARRRSWGTPEQRAVQERHQHVRREGGLRSVRREHRDQRRRRLRDGRHRRQRVLQLDLHSFVRRRSSRQRGSDGHARHGLRAALGLLPGRDARG